MDLAEISRMVVQIATGLLLIFALAQYYFILAWDEHIDVSRTRGVLVVATLALIVTVRHIAGI